MTEDPLIKAYQLADRLKELAPWEFMKEQEVFGVRIPDTGEQYFLSVMGTAGEHYSIAAYKGLWGLNGFWELHVPNTWVRPMELMLIPHFMISFENRELIDPAVRKKMKALGFTYRGKNAWPKLQQIIPGFVPAEPDEENLQYLIVIMEQAINVIERIKTKPDLVYPEAGRNDDYLVRVKVGETNDAEGWKDIWWERKQPSRRYHLTFKDRELNLIEKLPLSKDTLQADIALMSTPVSDPGTKPYFSSVYMVTNTNLGIITDFEMLTPLKGIDAMHARFPDLLIKSILKSQEQPASIEIRHPALCAMAEKVFSGTKIKIVLKNQLHHVNEVLANFEFGKF